MVIEIRHVISCSTYESIWKNGNGKVSTHQVPKGFRLKIMWTFPSQTFGVVLYSLKYIILFVAFFCSWRIAKAEDCIVTDEHLKQAKAQLRKLGFDPKQVGLEKRHLNLFGSCSNGICDETTDQLLIVTFSVASPIAIKNIKLQKGNKVALCDGKLSWLSLQGTNIIEGYKCKGNFRFDMSERLCRCTLAEDSVIDEIEIPKDTDFYLYKGKPYAVIFQPVSKAGEKSKPRGYYRFKNNKLEFQKDWDTLNTCENFIHTQ